MLRVIPLGLALLYRYYIPVYFRSVFITVAVVFLFFCYLYSYFVILKRIFYHWWWPFHNFFLFVKEKTVLKQLKGDVSGTINSVEDVRGGVVKIFHFAEVINEWPLIGRIIETSVRIWSFWFAHCMYHSYLRLIIYRFQIDLLLLVYMLHPFLFLFWIQ